MKKCTIGSIIFLLLTQVACNNVGNNADSASDTAKIEFTRIDTTATAAIDTLDKASPCLKFEISLPFAQGNSPAAQSINSSIIYTTFGLDGSDAQTAIDTAFARERDEYLAQRPHYLNEKSMEHSPVWFNQEISIKGTESRGLDNCINYTIESYTFSGGAHGMETTTLLNFNAKNGAEIILDSIFTPNFEQPLSAALISALGLQLGATTPEEINEKGYFNIEELYPTNNFLLTKDSIIFLYNPYEIAPYSMGSTRIALGYNQIQQLLKK